MIIVFCLLLAVLGLFTFRFWSNRQARMQAMETPLSAHERKVIAEMVPITKKLPADLHTSFEEKVQLFRHQIDFVGCNGLEVTEDMRLSIAAQACLLVVNSNAWYDNLRTVLIYPGAFKSRRMVQHGDLILEEESVRLGESWSRGPVVLSWPHVEQGGLNYKDGSNLVLHEFAHQFDDLSGDTDGVPLLRSGQCYAEWDEIFVKGYEDHVRQVEKGRRTFLDDYGATGPEEFFAVSVEVFFEKPKQLQREEPQIYAQLSNLFGLDPVTWT
ncbi:MAG: M90 family metallopeptidase [Pseudomonadota bacterium]